MSLGEEIRHEARMMVEQGEIRTPTYMVILKVAKRLDERPSEPYIDADVYAEALRYENVQMNGHPADEWPDIPEEHRELWRKKVARVQKAIEYVTDRRSQT